MNVITSSVKPAPASVIAALAHVRTHYPKVTLVVFKRDGRWLYMDDDFESPVFGDEIDLSILEAAADDALPSSMYEVETNESE